MRTIEVHEAVIEFSLLLAEIEQHGTAFVLCRDGRPVADLVPHRGPHTREPDSPPNEQELVGPFPQGSDQKHCVTNFLGKTQDEMTERFRHRFGLAEAFSYMAPAGLCYYLPAALKYLMSEEASGDANFVGVLMCSLSNQVQEGKLRREPLKMMGEIATYCATHRSKFDLAGDALFNEYLEAITKAG